MISMLTSSNDQLKTELNTAKMNEQKIQEEFKRAILEHEDRFNDLLQDTEAKLDKERKDRTELQTAFKHVKEELQRLQLWCSISPNDFHQPSCSSSSQEVMINNLQTDNAQLQAQLDHLLSDASKQALKNHIQTLEQQVQILTQDLNQTKDEHSKLEKDNSSLKTEVKLLRDELGHLEQSTLYEETLLEKDFKDLQDNFNVLTNVKAANLEEIKRLEKINEDLIAKEETLKREDHEKLKQVEELKRIHAYDLTIIDQLKEKSRQLMNEMNLSNTRLKEQVNALTLQNAQIQKEKADLTEELRIILSQFELSQCKLESHSDQVQSLKAEFENVCNEITGILQDFYKEDQDLDPYLDDQEAKEIIYILNIPQEYLETCCTFQSQLWITPCFQAHFLIKIILALYKPRMNTIMYEKQEMYDMIQNQNLDVFQLLRNFCMLTMRMKNPVMKI